MDRPSSSPGPGPNSSNDKESATGGGGVTLVTSASSSPSRCSVSSTLSLPSSRQTTTGSPVFRGISSSSSSSEPGSRSPNRLSKLFSQLKTTLGNLIVEAANTSGDVAPGIDHCSCKTSRCHYGLPIHNLDADQLVLLAPATPSSNPNASSPNVSSSTLPPVRSRLIVYRDCDRRGRKILFDSEHVSSDYVYLKPSDPKLLKQLGDYVFGCVPLASTSSLSSSGNQSQSRGLLDLSRASSCGHMRFCKWKLQGQPQFERTHQTLYIWSKIFEMGSYNANKSTKQDTVSSSDYSSSSSEHSSSGYESGGGGGSGSGSGGSSCSTSSSGKTYSLPLFPQRLSSSWSGSGSQSSFPQTRSLPGRIDNYKTNLALVWILIQEDGPPTPQSSSSPSKKIPLPYLSPLVESLMLNPLSSISHNFYHNSNHFVTSLKNVSTSLNHDLCDFIGNGHVVDLALVKPPLPDMVNSKLLIRFLEMFLTNLDSGIVLNLKKWTEVKAILYFLKVVLKTCVCKCNLLDSRRDSLVETGTDVISAAGANELDCVDSGIDMEGSSSSKLLSSSSVFQAGRKWSVVSEEESDLGGEDPDDDEDQCGRVSFHLGDADVDQSEAKLALGEVDLSRLKGGKRRSSLESSTSGGEGSSPSDYIPSTSQKRPVEVKLSLSDSKLKDACSAKYTPCYYCNGTYITDHSRFNPFYFCQVLTKSSEQVTYDMEYVTFMKIIECYGAGSTRCFNLSEATSSSSTSLSGSDDCTQEPNLLSRKIKEFIEGYIKLAKVTNDSGKLDSYATFQMEEIRDNILE